MIPVNELKRGFSLFQDEYEEKALEVLRNGWYILGNEVFLFEKELAAELGNNCFVASVDNGLNAIHLGLLASGIKKGDEIIVQANGYIATMLGIIRCGAKPVFIEPDDTYNMDASQIEKAITENTRAVLVTHLYGLATDMKKIVDICNRHHILLFEDCAQSQLASFHGRNTGTFGKAGFFSFYPTKNLGAFGDGGAVVSTDSKLIHKVKILRNYGSDYRYHNIEIGYNSRLDELQAALLRVKLKHYSELLKNRRSYAERYLKGILNEKVELPQIPLNATHIWYQFVIKVSDRDDFRKYMEEKGVKTDVNWDTPPYLQPALRFLGHKKGDFPITEKICERIVSLPMMDYMTYDELEYIIVAVNQY